jgi:hypothetical protein
MSVAAEQRTHHEPRRSPALSRDLYGLRADLHADGAVLRALAARLETFPASFASHADLVFTVDVARSAVAHVVRRAGEGSRVVYESPAGEVRYDEDADVLSIVHREGVRVECAIGAGEVLASVRVPGPPSPWLLSRPMFSLPLMELLKRRGRFGLHAAGVALGDAAILAPGQSGAGKSTLAFALARDGFELLGDDLVFLTRDHDALRALPFADEIELGDEASALFSELASPAAAVRGWPKRRWSPRALGLSVARPSAPRVLLFPTPVRSAQSRVLPITNDSALLELLPNVILTDRESCEAHVDVLEELVRTSDCYRLETGHDLVALPALVRKLVDA